jgi:putative transposase
MSQQLSKLRHCSYNLQFHLILCTQDRQKCITKEMLNRLCEIFANTLEKWESKLTEFKGEADHVHLLISVNPKCQPSKLVNNLKTVSSRLIRKDFDEHLAKVYWGKPVFWSRSYCILSCGGASISVLKQYIQQQAEID